MPEENKYALLDASGGSFRPRKGIYYIPALQTRICEANQDEFQNWSDFILACKQYPEEQEIYWLHLQTKPDDWDDDVFTSFPDDGLLVFGTRFGSAHRTTKNAHYDKHPMLFFSSFASDHLMLMHEMQYLFATKCSTKSDVYDRYVYILGFTF